MVFSRQSELSLGNFPMHSWLLRTYHKFALANDGRAPDCNSAISFKRNINTEDNDDINAIKMSWEVSDTTKRIQFRQEFHSFLKFRLYFQRAFQPNFVQWAFKDIFQTPNKQMSVYI